MVRVKCKECGAGVDLTKDGLYGHCASCNNIIEFTEEEVKTQQEEADKGAGDKNEKKLDENGDATAKSG